MPVGVYMAVVMPMVMGTSVTRTAGSRKRLMVVWPPPRLIRSSKGSERFPAELIPRGLEEIGLDFPKILVDRCHHHNMQFIAGLRMNDRHEFTPTQFIREHPEWQLGMGNAMDYAFEPVRGFVLTFVDEVLDEYEVDGLEYDYMRWCHMFKPD